MTNKTQVIRRVWGYIERYRIFVVISLALAVATVAMGLYIPILVGNAIDFIGGAGKVDFKGLGGVLIKIAAIAISAAAGQWIMNTINNRITFNVVRDIRNDAFYKIEHLPMSYIDTHRSGDMVSRVINDADRFADGLLMGFTQLFTGIMTIIGTLYFMFRINAYIAAVVVVLTPMSLLAARYIALSTYRFFLKQSETQGEETSFTDEMIKNLKTVKAFSRERQTIEEFDAINEKLRACSLKAVFFSSLTNPSTRLVNNTIYAVTALIGAVAATGGAFGAITIGQLSSFLSYATQYAKPFNEISEVIAELQNAIACAQRLLQLIDEEAETDDPDATQPREVLGNVEIKNVDFSYDKERELIKDLDLSVKSGQTIAIVGHTGCGKTTLINLLMRFYDVSGGAITVDGLDIRDIRRDSLRRSYGMVLQDTWLKADTIRRNIAIGKPDATDDEIIAAAKAAHAYGFIRRLPDGLDTVIGEDGGSLSHGQKQLLCIARVMLCLPPMLILDEATSSIDTRTEIKIQTAFRSMMRGRTSFIVAHRLSTIREADVIIVMDNGRIVEQGSHDKLIKKKGFYASLYNHMI